MQKDCLQNPSPSRPLVTSRAPTCRETRRGPRFRGRKRHPWAVLWQNPSPSRPPAAHRAPACREACRGRRFRGRKRHPRSFPRQNPSPLKSPVASSVPNSHETGQGRRIRGRKRHPCGLPRQPAPQPAPRHAEGEKSARDHRPISAILLANRNPPTNGSISPCHRNCASATDRTPGR